MQEGDGRTEKPVDPRGTRVASLEVRAVRMSSSLYDMIDRCAADMIAVHAEGGVISWASRSTEELFGWTPDELAGRSLAELAHPDDRERVQKHFAGGGAAAVAVRFRLRLPDGVHRWVETRTRRASGEAGAGALVSITRDVYMKPQSTAPPPPSSDVQELRVPSPEERRPTVLVVDDQPEMRQLFRAMLRDKYRVLCASDGFEALRILDEEPIAAVISDVMMPRMSGDELLRTVRRDPEKAHVPVLLVTARMDRQLRMRALRDGATDYVTKPFDRSELVARIDNLVQSATAFRSLRRQTRIDSLTGVFNRSRVLTVLQKQCELSVAGDYHLSVVMIDVDLFKRVNDTYGHAVGDEVIREVAQRLNDGVRSCDAVGRYGGEEFLVILPSCDYDQALAIAEALNVSVRATPIETSAGPITVTISGGVATRNGGACEPRELVVAADRALYRAKREGRNRIAA